MNLELDIAKNRKRIYEEIFDKLFTAKKCLEDNNNMVDAEKYIGQMCDDFIDNFKVGKLLVDKEEFLPIFRMSTSDTWVSDAKRHLDNEMMRTQNKIQEMNKIISELSED